MSIFLVVAEQMNAQFRKATLEAVSQAHRLALAEKGTVVVLAIGDQLDAEIAKLAEYGAQKTVLCQDARLAHYHPDYYKQVTVAAVQQINPDFVFFPGTTQGRDLAPRVAATLNTGLVSDCTGVSVADGQLKVERPFYAGKVFAGMVLSGKPQMVSLRPGVFEAKSPGSSGTQAVENMALPALESKIVLKQVRKTQGNKLDVTEANIIVTGGRGMRSADNFKLLEDLAQALGGAVGATRAVVDSGWRPHDEQVGQTGKVVSPSLYIMCGASGSIQHWAGMSGSKCIVAINKDPEAPIMKRADYGIVGDVFEILPALTTAIKKLKG